jgi:cyclase
VVASGGAGEMRHFADAFLKGNASAALAASLFHYGEVDIKELKQYLLSSGIPVRPVV